MRGCGEDDVIYIKEQVGDVIPTAVDKEKPSLLEPMKPTDTRKQNDYTKHGALVSNRTTIC